MLNGVHIVGLETDGMTWILVARTLTQDVEHLNYYYPGFILLD